MIDRKIIDQRDTIPLFKTGDVVQYNEQYAAQSRVDRPMIVLDCYLSKVESRLGTEYIRCYRLLAGDRRVEIYEFGLKVPVS